MRLLLSHSDWQQRPATDQERVHSLQAAGLMGHRAPTLTKEQAKKIAEIRKRRMIYKAASRQRTMILPEGVRVKPILSRDDIQEAEITRAKAAYSQGLIEVEELEARVERALNGEFSLLSDSPFKHSRLVKQIR